MTTTHFFKNFELEMGNTLAFVGAALRFWDKRMRMIVRGTLKRQIRVYFFTSRTKKHIEKYRRGNCASCGICCQYIRRCPHLTDDNTCGIYESRHLICRMYPVSDYDIQLISKISDKKCGFCFK
jgi:aldehyde:ferredoxin oxidoreductase